MSERISALEMAVGFELRLYDRGVVADWVTMQVLERETLDGSLLELSTSAHLRDDEISRELLALASEEPQAATEAEFTLACMGALVETNRMGLRAAITLLFSMTPDAFSEDDCADVYYLDDAYDLAASGVQGTLDQVRADFLALTSRYRHLLVGVR